MDAARFKSDNEYLEAESRELTADSYLIATSLFINSE